MTDQVSRQLFVVHNPAKGQTWIFNNHDAALRSRREQKLTESFLWGCVVFDDWRNGQPIRALPAGQGPTLSEKERGRS